MVKNDGNEDNSKQLKLSWNGHGLSEVVDVNNGKNNTHFKIEEDFLWSGKSNFLCKGNSEFFG